MEGKKDRLRTTQHSPSAPLLVNNETSTSTTNLNGVANTNMNNTSNATKTTLSGKAFYLDLRNFGERSRKVIIQLTSLGARVATEFDKEFVTDVITDIILTPELHQKILRNAAKPRIKPDSTRNTTTSFTSPNIEEEVGVVGIAYQLGKTVYHLDKIGPWLDAHCAAMEQRKQERPKPAEGRKYLIVKDRTGLFKPLLKEFTDDETGTSVPRFNFNAPSGVSPFLTDDMIRRRAAEKKKHGASAGLSVNTNGNILDVNKRRKLMAPCTCCGNNSNNNNAVDDKEKVYCCRKEMNLIPNPSTNLAHPEQDLQKED
eukprot:TRINITY_DN1637_c0_g1_i2.p1 TRINITY_DN1637_c0_g1~~TRINITY_DN1637_c0_g1_i2.p1  ORF type:complete len:314 (-),score=63.77 TRINITY_DN1637_c0_g1_i2:17-958(-)